MILRMCVRVSVCVCDVCVREMCVSEDWEDRREEDKEGADAALKTKKPHVNVGNNKPKNKTTPQLSTGKRPYKEQNSRPK